MAQIINRTNPEILANRRFIGLEFISISEKGMYFPKNTSFTVGISTDQYIHFINDGEFWSFYVNQNKDGFPFSKDKAGAYKIADRALARMFIRSTKRQPSDRMLIKATKAKHGASTIYEIYTQHTLDEVTYTVSHEEQKKSFKKKVRSVYLPPKKKQSCQ